MTRQDGSPSMLGDVVISRRTMLAGMASAMAVGAPFARPVWGEGAPGPPLLGAVFDHRFPQSRAFAARARTLLIKPLGFTADMSQLWFGEMLSALRTEVRPIVGLTSRRALFCFEQLAWDVGMRVRFRIEHVQTRDGFQHIASDGARSVVVPSLQSTGEAFGRNSFDTVLRCCADWGNCTHAVVPEIEELRSEPLTTWVIAPLRLVNAS